MAGVAQTNPRARAPVQPAESKVAENRVVESIVPWLAYNATCWSAVEVQNLGNREVTAEVEAHKSSGALARSPDIAESKCISPRASMPNTNCNCRKRPPAHGSGCARESLRNLSPVLAVSGATECLAANELHNTDREIVWPTRNPWYSGDVTDNDDGVIAMINISERPARVWGCYSFGVLYSVPHNDRPAAELTPVCSETIDEMVPPFGSRQFPVARGGNSGFSLKTRGDAIVLQMLRPAGTSVKVYRVDSTIKFGEEVKDQ